jgi:hypothetical protein
MKKTYYHAVTMDKMSSIMKHGILRNMSDKGVYFTDDAISSLDWIKCREQILLNKNPKSLGLVIFEVDTDDEFLVPIKDYGDNTIETYPKLMREAQKSECVIYSKSIHPSLLKFEECIIDGDDYDCYEKLNFYEYKEPTKKEMINVFVNGLEYAMGFDNKTGKHINPLKSIHMMCKIDPSIAERLFNQSVQQWA